MITDDHPVQRTNDDATQCKLAAVQLGYWSDDFVELFVSDSHQKIRRDPEISIGYWARVAAFEIIVQQFVQKFGDQAQIVNLGCGYDTLYWKLKSKGTNVRKFVEIDFSTVTVKKIRHIMKPSGKGLLEVLGDDVKQVNHCDLHAGDYQLIGADLRQWNELKGKLDSTGLDYSLPTLFLAECVLVYMSLDQGAQLFHHLADTFSTSIFFSYEQCHIDDKFGNVMERNLESRGIHLPGACKSKEDQLKRFTDNGFEKATVLSMDEIYHKLLSPTEIARIEKIEMLDEKELLWQLLSHYSIAVGAKPESQFNELLSMFKSS